MGTYLEDIDDLLTDVKELDTIKENCFEGFTHDIPKSVLVQRKRRAAAAIAASKASKSSTLKRPALLKAASGIVKEHGGCEQGEHDEQTNY